MLFSTDPGQPHVLPNLTFGLTDVSDWPAQTGEAPWILDPKECPKPVHPGPDSVGLDEENSTQKRKWRKKTSLQDKARAEVTSHGEGRNLPVWSQGGPGSSSESSSSVGSGFSSTQKKQGDNNAGATVCHGDWTPLLSPATVRKLDAGDLANSPLSDHPDYEPSDEHQEMTTTEEPLGTTVGDIGAGPSDTGTGNKDTGCNPRNPVDAQDLTGPNTGALASTVQIWALTSPALAVTMAQIQEATATGDDNDDTNEEKIRLDAYKGVMQGLHMASKTLSDGYQ